MQHAQKLGIDKGNIVVVWGAGGQLALRSTFLLKKIPQFNPKARALFNPAINMGPAGYGYERPGEVSETISPIDYPPSAWNLVL